MDRPFCMAVISPVSCILTSWWSATDHYPAILVSCPLSALLITGSLPRTKEGSNHMSPNQVKLSFPKRGFQTMDPHLESATASTIFVSFNFNNSIVVSWMSYINSTLFKVFNWTFIFTFLRQRCWITWRWINVHFRLINARTKFQRINGGQMLCAYLNVLNGRFIKYTR